jgi:hypothetical protein
MVREFRDRAALISARKDSAAALEFVQELADLEGKVDLTLRISLDDPKPREHSNDGRPVMLDSKYPGKCKACGKPYKAGDSVKWLKNVGCFCLGCKPKA